MPPLKSDQTSNMIYSMTAFAATEQTYPFGRLAWEMRSVNHRFLDISLRLPEEFRPLEGDFREQIAACLSRGKVDASLRFTPSSDFSSGQIALNEDLAKALLTAHSSLSELAGVEQTVSLAAVLRWPGVVSELPPDLTPLREAAKQQLTQACEGLLAARRREGEKLEQMLQERLQGIQALTVQVREWLPQIRDKLKLKLDNKLASLDYPVEPGRVEQELALYMQKLDVDEELDRLDSHVSEAIRTLSQSEPVGRRLDFLLQEFNREANTLGSKSVDSRTSQAGVELKVLIEQMREQVQNVE